MFLRLLLLYPIVKVTTLLTRFLILYSGVRYLRSSIPDHELFRFISDFFYGFTTRHNGYRCGTLKHNSMNDGSIKAALVPLRFFAGDSVQQITTEHPLNILLADMLPVFKAYYALIQHGCVLAAWLSANNYPLHTSLDNLEGYPDKPPIAIQEVAAKLDTHAHFEALLRRLLDECSWPQADYVGDRMAEPSPLAGPGSNAAKENESAQGARGIDAEAHHPE